MIHTEENLMNAASATKSFSFNIYYTGHTEDTKQIPHQGETLSGPEGSQSFLIFC